MQDADWQKVKEFAKLSDEEKAAFFENPTDREYLMSVFEIMKQCMGEIYRRLPPEEKTFLDWWEEGTVIDKKE